MIQLLIHRGANINHRNDDGWTPLGTFNINLFKIMSIFSDEAHACGKLDTAKLLLSHGASDRKIKRSSGSKSQFTRSGTL
jgi:ankyrin repeat protein